MRVLVLYNPVAGAGRAAAAAQDLRAALKTAGHAPTLRETEPAPAGDWLGPSLAAADLLLVVGGDGAARLACGPAALSGTPLYVFPFGTENLFAREFGFDRSVPRLLDALSRFEVRRVDLGRAGDRDFLLMASLGPDAGAVRDLASRRGARSGRLAWTGPLARQLWNWRAPRLTVRLGAETVVDGQRGMVFVANSRQYALRFDPAFRASMTDGLLDMVFFPCRSALGTLAWMVVCRLRRQLRSPQVIYRTGTRVHIRCEPEHPYQIDGDPPGPTSPVSELQLDVRPAAVPVLVPQVRRLAQGRSE